MLCGHNALSLVKIRAMLALQVGRFGLNPIERHLRSVLQPLCIFLQTPYGDDANLIFSTSAIRCEEAELSCCRSHPKQKRQLSEAVRLRVNAQITSLQKGPIVLNHPNAPLIFYCL